MSWHYLRERGGESLEDICSDGEQLSPLKSKITHAVFYCNGKLMDSYLDSLSGTTFAPLMGSLGEEKSKSLAVDFHVPTSQPQDAAQELMEKLQESGEKWRGWLAKYDHNTSLWKTPQCSLLEEELESLETLPKWGMTVNGLLWEQPMLMPHTRETECGLLANWPTPVHSEARQGLQIRREGKKGTQTSLSTAVLTWPTPRTKGMCGGSGSWDLLNKNTTVEEARLMGAGNGGQLNPMWVEWLMGWPLGWTDLKPLGMGKSHCVRQPHGES